MGGESQSHSLLPLLPLPSSLFSFMAQSVTHAYTYLPHAVPGSLSLRQKTALSLPFTHKHTHAHRTHLSIGENTPPLFFSFVI